MISINDRFKSDFFRCLATVILVCLLVNLSDNSHSTISQYGYSYVINKSSYAVLHNDTDKLSQHSLNRSYSGKTSEPCQRRFPGAIVAGIQKCGTGALTVFLNLHPQIAAVLNPDFPDGNIPIELKFFSMQYSKGLDWYRQKMPCSFANQVTIEKDPPYFYNAKSARRIKEMDPSTKIIFIVKEPIDRALSNHVMDAAKYTTKYTTFEETVLNVNGSLNKKCGYLGRSSYVKFIDPWIDQFGLDQILFLDGHKFEVEPVQELQRVERFLNIDSFFDEDMFWFNKTKGKPCFYSKGTTALCLGENKGREHPTISERLRLSLQTYFKPLNELFFRKIKTRFTWGY